jgi:uncharacterized membrane protein
MLRWGSGYLDDEELVHQLKEWGALLDRSGESAQFQEIQSVIVVLDNILELGEAPFTCQGVFDSQRVRS